MASKPKPGREGSQQSSPGAKPKPDADKADPRLNSVVERGADQADPHLWSIVEKLEKRDEHT